jgi:iron complex transport system substrate-binding protein
MAVDEVTSHGGCTRRLRRLGLAIGVAGLLGVAACSGSDADVAEVAETTESATVDGSEDLFDPTNPDGTEPPVAGTAVQLDDDVIIATEDGQIPPTTTEPPIDPDGPDAPPPIDVSPTTAAPVPLPDPADVGRIVSMSPTHTETLFALGLGEFVVAVDARSDYPEAALEVRRDDLDADSSDLAPLLALDPDVVIIGEDRTGLAQRLDAAGIASYSGPPAASLDDVYDQILGIASVVGRPELGEDLVDSMRASIAATVASLPDTSTRTYFHEIDPSYITITAGTFLDSVYGEMGLVSIVPPDPSGFTQASSDQVLAADPDVLILADAECCDVTIDVVAGRPGWSSLSAVSNGAVVELADYMAFRWGPRVVDLVETVAVGVASAA